MTDKEKSAISRSDPGLISTPLKEAVAHGLLGSIFERLSGNGRSGLLVQGEKPSRRFTSAFLMPANPDEENLDDETSPIRITATGFDFMVLANAVGTVRTIPQFSIYVRVLPSVEELMIEGVGFRLTPEIDRQVRRQVRETERSLWEDRREELGGDKNHPEWIQQRRNIANDVYEEFGVYENSVVMAVEGTQELTEGGDDTYEARGFRVRPGVTEFPSSDVVRAERPLEKWVRIPVVCGEFEFQLDNGSVLESSILQSNTELNAAIQNSIDLWLSSEDLNTGGVLWGYPRGRTFSPSEVANWAETIQQIREQIASMSLAERRGLIALPELNIEWAVAVKPDWSDSSRRAVHVALENRSARPRRNADTEESIFQVRLTCQIPCESHTPMRLDRIKSSYRFNRYLHYSALGFNCGVRDASDGQFLTLETDWMPKYALPKIEPTTHGIDCTFQSLASSDRSIEAVSNIASELRTWIEELDIDVSDGLAASEEEKIQRERAQFDEDLHSWSQEASMIQRGIDLLRRSSQCNDDDSRSIPFRAWLLMNETMRRLALGRYDSWRLFQLGFVLATLPSLVTRMPEFASDFDEEVDEATTLLYFSTGGGKSEAFFGLLVFGLFFDRLRGKELGVTAMLRYPLRLLTVQQAQRAAKVLAVAEVVRHNNSIDGHPFSIGFWVGSSNTPNYHGAPGVSDIPYIDDQIGSEETLRDSNRKYKQAISDWLKLPTCPFCGGMTGLRRTRAANAVLQDGIVGHVCSQNNCEWNRLHTDTSPLPFYIIDSDIYSIAPSVLLGTIDKLALIGQSTGTIKRVLGMFGFAPWQDAASGRFINPNHRHLTEESENVVLLKPVYNNGEGVFFDPFPSLLIQDEAHLLEESLGTFAGLFETALFEVYKRLAEYNPSVAKRPNGEIRMPKIVAATATVSDPERQIENLYQKRLIQFPYPGPRLYESFYAAPEMSESILHESDDVDVEEVAHQRRIYATVLTNGKPHTTASVAVLSAFHSLITSLFRSFVEGEQGDKETARQVLVDGIIGTNNESYTATITAAPFDHLATLIDLHRIALTYVTNKKGGDQILSAEAEQVRKDHAREGLQNTNFDRRLITGSVDAGLIQQVIAAAERRSNPGESFYDLDSCLRSIVATSAISHGVDVEELNSMFFAGMPSDIAEYIQASSRVGRTHVGFSLLLPVPQRKRDRYIVETHDIFHRFLERMIQPPAIDRWAENALVRVVPSFFQTYLISVLLFSRLIEAPPNEKANTPTFGMVSHVRNVVEDPVAFREGIVKFISDAVGLGSNYEPTNAVFYRELIQKRVRRLLDDIAEPDMANLTMHDFFNQLARRSPETLEKPMTSLRDVDVPGLLVPAPEDTGTPRARLNDEQLAELMRFLRRGGGGVVGSDGA